MKKRILSVITVISVVIACFAAPLTDCGIGFGVIRAEAATYGDYEYEVNTDGVSVTITKYKGSGGDVTIPSEIDGKAVTEIGYYAFLYCTSLNGITIPNSVISIGTAAFGYCENITSVVIPNSVTNLGEEAFENCKNLTSATIPGSVVNIGYRTFYKCQNLQSVTLGNGIKSIDNAFGDCVSLTSITIPNSVTSIGDFTFGDCTNLSTIIIPDSVTRIGSYAFSGTKWYYNQPDGVVYAGKVAYEWKGDMPEHTSITLKAGTNGIASNAFYSCDNLSSISIPNSVENIGDSAFSGCTELISISIPDSVTSIGYGVFDDCTNLITIIFPDSLVSIGDYAFAGTAWYNNQPDGVVYAGKVAYKWKGNMPQNTAIILKNDTKSIADYAFEDCENLTSIQIPDSVTTMGMAVFIGCTNLNSAKIPDSVTSIGEGTFYYCTGLKTVIIGNGVTSISGNREGKSSGSYGMFYNCSSLTTVEIGSGVTNIGVYAFGDCESLTSITFKSQTPPNFEEDVFGGYVFDGCLVLNTIYVPKGSKAAYKAEPQLSGYTILEEGEDPPSADDFEYEVNAGEVTITGYKGSGGSVTIPSEIDGKPVTAIGDQAFWGYANITSITIPDCVTSIGDYAFAECTNLTSINVDENNSVYSTSIDGVLFDKNKTTLISCPGGKQGEYTIPDSVTVIGGGAFFGCGSLTSVVIPAGVTSIGNEAFVNCSELISLTFKSQTPPTLGGNSVFSGCKKLEKIYVPVGATGAYQYVFSGYTVEEREAPVITTDSLPNGVTNTAYLQYLDATGSTPIIWSVVIGSLPDGLTLDPDTGVISGTPTKDGPFSFTVKAENDVSSDTKALSIEIATAPTIDKVSLPLTGTINTQYKGTITAKGTAPITWSVVSGSLPTGLTLNPATGEISGKPTAAGTFEFTIMVENIVDFDTRTFSITIQAPPTITTDSLPNGVTSFAYSQTLTADGTTPITWSIASGSLPDGLTLNAATGVISGTPTTEGTFEFTVRAANIKEKNVTKKLSITIVSDLQPNAPVKIEISPSYIAVKPGESVKFTVTATPSDANLGGLVWKLDDKIAGTSVREITVSATKTGSHGVSAEINAGGKIRKVFAEIYVYDETEKHAVKLLDTKVTLNLASKTGALLHYSAAGYKLPENTVITLIAGDGTRNEKTLDSFTAKVKDDRTIEITQTEGSKTAKTAKKVTLFIVKDDGTKERIGLIDITVTTKYPKITFAANALDLYDKTVPSVIKAYADGAEVGVESVTVVNNKAAVESADGVLYLTEDAKKTGSVKVKVTLDPGDYNKLSAKGNEFSATVKIVKTPMPKLPATVATLSAKGKIDISDPNSAIYVAANSIEISGLHSDNFVIEESASEKLFKIKAAEGKKPVPGFNYEFKMVLNGTKVNKPLVITPAQTASKAVQSKKEITLYEDSAKIGEDIMFDLITPENVKLGEARIEDSFSSSFELSRTGQNSWYIRFKDGKFPTKINGQPLAASYTVNLELWAEGTYGIGKDGKPIPLELGTKESKPTIVSVKVNIR